MNPVKIFGTVLKFVTGPLTSVVNAIPKGSTAGVGGVLGGVGTAVVTASDALVPEQYLPIAKAFGQLLIAVGLYIVGAGAQRAKAAGE